MPLDQQGALAPLGGALLAPIAAGNAFEQTVQRLLQVIKLGIVPPGERLPPERELAQRLGVSRAKLRDALRELGHAGQVEVRRGRAGGTFVRPPLPFGMSSSDLSSSDLSSSDLSSSDLSPAGVSPTGGGTGDPAPPTAQQVEDVLTCRWVLEVGAVELAAAAPLSAAARSTLTGHLEAACSAGQVEYRRLDSRLHLALAELTGSASVIRSVAESRMQANLLLDRIPLLGPNLSHSNAQHRAIVGAVLRGDPAAARASMIEHLAGTAALLRGFLT